MISGIADVLGVSTDLNVSGIGFLTAVGVTGSVTSGAMSFDIQASATVTTAASYADAITLASDGPSGGKAVLFTAGSDEYLFIQGGADGTDDDYIVKFNGTNGSTLVDATIELLGD